MIKNSKTLVLLDAHAIIHRAYHALPDFLSSKGEPTGALYGLSSMLMKIITELKPDYLIACYDLPEKTFRHKAYDAYKAGRKKTDTALISQLINSREIFEAFGVPMYDAPGFEADDILGTITEKFKSNRNIRTIIASGDMDTMQLVKGNEVQVYTLKKGINDTVLYNEDKVKERFGFEPKLLPDYKGLRGDPSDNIIGIKGIGEKTATELIKKFQTIERIFKELKRKDSDEYFKKLGFSERIIKLLKEGEEEAVFSKTLAKIRVDAPIEFVLPDKEFKENFDSKKVERMFEKFEFRSLAGRLINLFSERKVFKERNELEDLSKELSNEEKPTKNTIISFWLLNPNINDPKTKEILNFTKTDSLTEAEKILLEKLKKENLEKVYEEIEKPIIESVKRMQDYGIMVDKNFLEGLSVEYHKELNNTTQNIYTLAGEEFNINSPKQLGEILFKKLELKSKKKSAKGAQSTKIDVLEELEEAHPIIKQIIKHRELSKLLSTYIDTIPKMINEDGRLHAEFVQHGTATGRFSSQNPNLQNLPTKSEQGKRVRQAFVAKKGWKLIAFDYSQIELRVAGILSGDKKMAKIFNESKDVHSGVASFVFNVPQEKVTKEMRRKAKVINFGIIYGMGISALRKNLGGTREEAQEFYNNYFIQFSGLQKYLEEVKDFAINNKYSITLFGRKRFLPDINSRIPFLKAFALRTATNSPIQGTAADIIKLAIRYAEEDLEKEGLTNEAHLVLQIHDELVYEVKEEVVNKVIIIVKKAMEGILERSYLHYKTDIPIVVHSEKGDNFGELI